jgi:aminoglycoside phosphotransferase
MAGAVYLSRLLRPRGVPLPAILAEDVEAKFPWLLLQRLPGTDLGEAMSGLTEDQLDAIAAKVAQVLSSAHWLSIRNQLRRRTDWRSPSWTACSME